MKYQKTSLVTAARNALNEVAAIEGSGGVIVVDKKGGYTMEFNTAGMYRGTIGSDGKAQVAIYGD